MKTVIVIVALMLSACSTTQRPKANLAIDAEPSTAPAEAEADKTEISDEGRPPAGEIELGLEGSSGSIQVEGAMSSAEEDEALAADTPKKDKKKGDKKKGSDEEEEEEGSEEEEAEE